MIYCRYVARPPEERIEGWNNISAAMKVTTCRHHHHHQFIGIVTIIIATSHHPDCEQKYFRQSKVQKASDRPLRSVIKASDGVERGIRRA